MSFINHSLNPLHFHSIECRCFGTTYFLLCIRAHSNCQSANNVKSPQNGPKWNLIRYIRIIKTVINQNHEKDNIENTPTVNLWNIALFFHSNLRFQESTFLGIFQFKQLHGWKVRSSTKKRFFFYKERICDF